MQVATNPFLRFYTFLAKMGLVMLDDPPKVIEMTGREWGEAVDGLALSIRELPRDESQTVVGISVVMRNTSAVAKQLSVQDWTRYFEIEKLELTPYGRKLFGDAARLKTLTLDSAGAIEAELPIGRIYSMPSPGIYVIQVHCALAPDGRQLRSNTITIRA